MVCVARLGSMHLFVRQLPFSYHNEFHTEVTVFIVEILGMVKATMFQAANPVHLSDNRTLLIMCIYKYFSFLHTLHIIIYRHGGTVFSHK